MQGRVPPSLSGLRATHRLRFDESRAPHQAAHGSRPSPRQGREGEGRDHQDFLRRIFCRDGPSGGILHRNRARRVSGTSAAAGKADASRPAGEPRRHQAHGPDDGGRRKGRYLLDRPDAGRAGSLHRRARLSQGAPHAGRRRSLRRVLGPALEQRNLSAAAGFCAR